MLRRFLSPKMLSVFFLSMLSAFFSAAVSVYVETLCKNFLEDEFSYKKTTYFHVHLSPSYETLELREFFILTVYTSNWYNVHPTTALFKKCSFTNSLKLLNTQKKPNFLHKLYKISNYENLIFKLKDKKIFMIHVLDEKRDIRVTRKSELLECPWNALFAYLGERLYD